MAEFEHTNKVLDFPIDIHKEKRISKFFKTNFILEKIRKIPASEIGNFRIGIRTLTVLGIGFGYYFYKQSYKQRMISSHYYYKLINLSPICANNEFWYGRGLKEAPRINSYWYRMPQKVFDVKYRMRSAYINGEFDHNKEILIPRKKNGVIGYEIITPFYYYIQVSNDPTYIAITQDGKPVDKKNFDRGGMAVDRGW